MSDVFSLIYQKYNGESFIFVLDNWDYIHTSDYANESDKLRFNRFLRSLLDNKCYVEIAIATSTLPIVKYRSCYDLDVFVEHTMLNEYKFSSYFGFTEKEVDILYQRYLTNNRADAIIKREDLRAWYGGYRNKGGEEIYNPCSLIKAIEENELKIYFEPRLMGLVPKEPIKARLDEYASTAKEIRREEEKLSTLAVYGLLTYREQTFYIPNREIKSILSIT